MVKLMKRAIQIKDAITELNPKEASTDPRTLKPGMREIFKMQAVNNMCVYGGVDGRFNALRILPPHQLIYPDFVKDEQGFFD